MDQDDLNRIVDALTQVLAPQLREVVNELVSVRVESSLQAVQLRVDDALAAVKVDIDSVTGEARGLVGTATAALDVAHAALQKEVSDAVARFEAEVKNANAETARVIRESEDRAESGRVESERLVQEVREKSAVDFMAAHKSIADQVEVLATSIQVLKDAGDGDGEPDEMVDPAAFADVCSRLGAVEDSMKSHGTKLESVATEQEAHVSTLDAHGTMITEVKSAVEEMRSMMDSKASKKSVDEIQEQLTLWPTQATEKINTQIAGAVAAANEELVKRETTLCDGIQASVDSQVAVLLRAHDDQTLVLVKHTVEELVPAIAKEHVVTNFNGLSVEISETVAKRLEEHETVSAVSAREAAASAAGDSVPALVDAQIGVVREALIEHAVQHAKAAAKEDTAIAFAGFEPLITERIEELASQVSIRTATAMVPDLVDSRASELTAAVVARATEQASEAASGAAVAAGEAAGRAALADVLAQAEIVAKEAAEPIAAAAATVAARALEDDLRIALDPTVLVSKAVQEAIDSAAQKLSVELGDAIGDSTKTHIQNELPRIQLELTARVQSFIDSIPIPKDGEDGKDGKITPTEPWEEGKKYKSGAWVSHANGIWIAARSWTETEPAADNRDWECVVSGLTDFTVTQEGDRVLRFVATMTDGKVHNGEAYLNIPVVRGVYSETYAYAPSDIVTHSGSSWVAQKSGVLARPGVNADEWKLQVKEGRKGTSAEMPSRGERFKGVWKAEWLYHEGDVVQHAGYRWLAMRSTREQPLRSDDTWSKMGESQ